MLLLFSTPDPVVVNSDKITLVRDAGDGRTDIRVEGGEEITVDQCFQEVLLFWMKCFNDYLLVPESLRREKLYQEIVDGIT